MRGLAFGFSIPFASIGSGAKENGAPGLGLFISTRRILGFAPRSGGTGAGSRLVARFLAGNKKKSAASIKFSRKRNATGGFGSFGYGGHFRAVQGFAYRRGKMPVVEAREAA